MCVHYCFTALPCLLLSSCFCLVSQNSFSPPSFNFIASSLSLSLSPSFSATTDPKRAAKRRRAFSGSFLEVTERSGQSNKGRHIKARYTCSASQKSLWRADEGCWTQARFPPRRSLHSEPFQTTLHVRNCASTTSGYDRLEDHDPRRRSWQLVTWSSHSSENPIVNMLSPNL